MRRGRVVAVARLRHQGDARCVLPVPIGPAKMMLSARAIHSPRGSSASCGALTDGQVTEAARAMLASARARSASSSRATRSPKRRVLLVRIPHLPEQEMCIRDSPSRRGRNKRCKPDHDGDLCDLDDRDPRRERKYHDYRERRDRMGYGRLESYCGRDQCDEHGRRRPLVPAGRVRGRRRDWRHGSGQRPGDVYKRQVATCRRPRPRTRGLCCEIEWAARSSWT